METPLGPAPVPRAAIWEAAQEGPVSGEFSSEIPHRLHGCGSSLKPQLKMRAEVFCVREFNRILVTVILIT